MKSIRSTYDSAKLLNDFKLKYNLIDQKTYHEVNENMAKSLVYIKKIDDIMELPEAEKELELDKLKQEMEDVNEYSICGKHELKWEVKKNYANVFSLTVIGLELLIADKVINLKQRYKESVQWIVGLKEKTSRT